MDGRYRYTVSVIDTATNTLSAVNHVGTFPLGVAVSPDRTHLYVCANTGLVIRVLP